MAESISISLRHIQNLLQGIGRSWVHNKLRELMSMLIQIQEGEDRQVLQEFHAGLLKDYLDKNKHIRSVAYSIDDELDSIYIYIKSCERKINSDIPNVVKQLVIAYYKKKVLNKILFLINLVRETKFIRKEIFIKEWNEIEKNWIKSQRLDYNFSYDFEKRISMSDGDFLSFIANLISKNNKETFDGIDLPDEYIYIEAIYDDISIRKHFQYVVRISLSLSSERITFYRDILKKLLSNDKKYYVAGLMFMKEDELLKELMKVLTNYKCLILFEIDYLTQNGDLVQQLDVPMRSKLLFNINADYMEARCPLLYRWKIIESITIQNREKENGNFDELKRIGLELIGECNIVPRQVIRMGGILREDVSIQHWEIVQKSLSGDHNNDRDHDWRILALCYDHLCIHLKACFLYFGYFWKGDDINTEMLYQLWMAEGLVSSNLLIGEEQTTMDIAQMYLATFARKLLIDVQEFEFSTVRRFVLCRTDYFVNKFCQDHGNILLDIYMVHESEMLFCCESSSQDGRKLFMKFDSAPKDEFLHSGKDKVDIVSRLKLASAKLRTLLMKKEKGTRMQTLPFEMICKKFKLLRVLKIENFEIDSGKLPKDISNLFYLRFLSLEGSTIEEFPNTLGNFKFMQTLDLRVVEIIPRGTVVPNVLWKLKELMHLYLPSCYCLPKGKDSKLSLNGLDKLETLVNFDTEKVELTSLEWKSLRHIDVKVHGKKGVCDVIDYMNKSGDKLKETFLRLSFLGFSHEDSDVPSVDVFNCTKLNHLIINWGRCDLNESKILSVPLTANLIELRLLRCIIRKDPMPILGTFPQLRKLILGKKSFMGTCLTLEEDSFPALRYLKIKDVKYLEELKIKKGSMSNLSYLKIICCLKLKMIPTGLKFLENLTKLKFRMPKKFNDRIRIHDETKGADCENVEHVRYIYLQDW